MEENQKFDGFNNQSYAPEYAPGYSPEATGMQSADMANLTYPLAEEGSKKGKKAKKEKKSKKGNTENAVTEVAAADGAEGKDKKEKKPVDPELKKIYNRKTTVLTTYFVALLCLIAGLVVPLFNFVEGVAITDRLMFKYIPSMLNYFMVPIFGWGLFEIPADGSGIFKPMVGQGGVFTFTCVIGVLYAVITVVAIAMFIPILLTGIGKKNKKTGATAALVVEIIAVLITATYVAFTTYSIISNSGSAWKDYNFFIPLGGVLLMAIFQVITAKRGLGVSKTIAVILSAIGVFALLDFATFIPQIGPFIGNIAGQFDIGTGFIGGLELSPRAIGIDGLDILINITSYGNYLVELASTDVKLFIVYILFVLATIFTLINLVVDVLGLATGRLTKKDYRETLVPARDKDGNIKRGRNGKDKMKKVRTDDKAEIPWNNPVSNTFAIVRYTLTLIFMGAILAIGLLWKESNGSYSFNIGVYFYLLLGVLVLSLFNAAIRTGVANTRKDKAKKKMLKEDQESRMKVNFVGAEQYGNQPYGYPANYYGAYGQPQQPYNQYANQQPAYDPYANQQQPAYDQYANQQQPAYDPYANQQQPAYATEQQPAPAPEQTNYAQEQQVQEQQPVNPYYTDYPQNGYDPYANANANTAPANDYVAPVYQEPVQQPAPAPVYQEPVQVQNPFDVSLDEAPVEPVPGNYDGPTDAFMNTLNDDEKSEFLEVFVDKTKGSVKGIPDYVIGEDNSEFFPMVFVHINRFRNTVSDGLMSKLYKQLIK